MVSILALAIVTTIPASVTPELSCEGIRLIEQSASDKPSAFASLRQVVVENVRQRNNAGVYVERPVPITKVKPLEGLTDCQFVYNSYISVACYGASAVSAQDTEAVEARLNAFAEHVGTCFSARSFRREESEPGSTRSVSFGAGPTQSFWAISMVPLPAATDMLRPELLVLGPAEAVPARTTPPTLRHAAKKKAKAKRRP